MFQQDQPTIKIQVLTWSRDLTTLAGGEVTVTVPNTDPGKARDILLRAECTAATDLTFAGADFEGSEGDELNAPTRQSCQ